MRRWVEAQRRAGCVVPAVSTDIYLFNPDKNLRNLFPNARGPESAPENGTETVSVSLVVTFKNDSESLPAWISSLEKQEFKPAELVLVDANEAPALDVAMRKRVEIAMAGNEVKVLHRPKCNIAGGRNFGVTQSTGEVVAFTDLGCTLDSRWLERLITPFVLEPATELSSGWYEPVVRSAFARSFADYSVPKLAEIDVERFIPSARSFAIKRELFTKLNGFPEYLTMAGEDSLFGYYAKFLTVRAAFVPEAIVRWDLPQSASIAFVATLNYAAGDAEGGRIAWRHYLDLVRAAPRFPLAVLRYPRRGEAPRYLQLAVVWVLLSAQLFGFVRGYKRRREIFRRRLELLQGVAFLLSSQPITADNSDPYAQFEHWRKMDYLVINVYSLAGAAEVRFERTLEHQRLLSFLRIEFDLERFLNSVGEMFVTTKKFVVIDCCQDGSSRELAEQIKIKFNVGNVRQA
jgi:glycosyltransferase involved in cell wall biosynthesis